MRINTCPLNIKGKLNMPLNNNNEVNVKKPNKRPQTMENFWFYIIEENRQQQL